MSRRPRPPPDSHPMFGDIAVGSITDRNDPPRCLRKTDFPGCNVELGFAIPGGVNQIHELIQFGFGKFRKTEDPVVPLGDRHRGKIFRLCTLCNADEFPPQFEVRIIGVKLNPTRIADKVTVAFTTNRQRALNPFTMLIPVPFKLRWLVSACLTSLRRRRSIQASTLTALQ